MFTRVILSPVTMAAGVAILLHYMAPMFKPTIHGAALAMHNIERVTHPH